MSCSLRTLLETLLFFSCLLHFTDLVPMLSEWETEEVPHAVTAGTRQSDAQEFDAANMSVPRWRHCQPRDYLPAALAAKL